MKFGYNRPRSFREIVDRQTDNDRRTTEPAYTISFPGAFGSGELKNVFFFFFFFSYVFISIHLVIHQPILN